MIRWISGRRSRPGPVLAAALIALVAATACASADNGDTIVAAEAASAGAAAIDSSVEESLPAEEPLPTEESLPAEEPAAEPVVPFHPDGFEGITDVPSDVYDPFTSGEAAPDGFRQLLRRDLIAPVYEPTFVRRGDVTWPDDELVIGVDLEGEARAYPVGFLNRREIVVDLHRGIPTLVTW